jgi:hypothetical protein
MRRPAKHRSSSRASTTIGPFELIVAISILVVFIIGRLPDGEFTNALKLMVASPIVLLLPGAALVRLLGWSRTASGLFVHSFIWSLMIAAASLLIAFVLETSVVGALVAYFLATIGFTVAGWGRPLPEFEREELHALLLVVGLGILCGFVLVVGPQFGQRGDWVEHLGRTRKIAELPELVSLESIQLVGPDIGLHPMYAFPLWHGVMAFIARFVALDSEFVVMHLATLLAPIAAVTAFHAGRIVFGTTALGVATAVVQLTWISIPWKISQLDRLAEPGHVVIVILYLVAIGATFSYLRRREFNSLALLAATSLAMTLLHASYVPHMLIPLGSFLLLHFAVERDVKLAWDGLAVLVAILLPFLIYLPWIYPTASAEGTSLDPAGQLATSTETYRTLIDVAGLSVRMGADAVMRAGALLVAGTLLIPACIFAIRKRWGAFVVGGFLGLAIMLMTYPGFMFLVDLMNISQSRRLVLFIPVAFMVVAGACVIARQRLALIGALVIGAVLWIAYPGDFGYWMHTAGPGWVAWVAVAAAVVGIVAVLWRKLPQIAAPARYATGAAVCLCIPILIGSFLDLPGEGNLESLFSEEFVEEFRDSVEPGAIVFGRGIEMYKLTAEVPVFSNATQPGHGGDTSIAKLDVRYEEGEELFYPSTSREEGLATLEKYDSEWLVVDEARNYPGWINELPLEFSEDGFSVYAVPD